MMTKIKSGFAAQIKALVVIPAAMFLFFFFSDITFSKNVSAQESVGFTNKLSLEDIQGFWQNESKETYGQLINFDSNTIQILESNDSYKEFSFMLTSSIGSLPKEQYIGSKIEDYIEDENDLTMMVVKVNDEGSNWSKKPVFLVLKDDQLIIEWSKKKMSIYKHVDISNSLQLFTQNTIKDFKPVSTSYYRIAEKPKQTFHLLIDKNGNVFLDNKSFDLEEFEKRIWEKKNAGNPFDAWDMNPILDIDARCPMKYVTQLLHKMCNNNMLRYIFSVKPLDDKVPEIFYHNVGIPRLLPPKDAVLIPEEEFMNGANLIRIDLNNRNTSIEKAKILLEKEIKQNRKYVILYIYNDETSYNDYLTYLDQVYQVVFEKRNQLAQDKYNLNYDDLATSQQQEIRKEYPLTLTERNVDQPED